MLMLRITNVQALQNVYVLIDKGFILRNAVVSTNLIKLRSFNYGQIYMWP